MTGYKQKGTRLIDLGPLQTLMAWGCIGSLSFSYDMNIVFLIISLIMGLGPMVLFMYGYVANKFYNDVT